MSYAYHPESRPDYQSKSRPQSYQLDSRPQSYHQSSSRPQSRYYDPSSPSEEPFDVRADFDGTGPRWSDRYGQSFHTQETKRPQTLLEARGMESYGGSDRGYKPIDEHVPPAGAGKGDDEMISVPVLGPE
jgi:hypothetical protein